MFVLFQEGRGAERKECRVDDLNESTAGTDASVEALKLYLALLALVACIVQKNWK